MFFPTNPSIVPGVIEIEFARRDPVQGWVRDVGDRRSASAPREICFSGWLGLVQAVVTLADEVLSDQTGKREGAP
jgi:hypothetical protein